MIRFNYFFFLILGLPLFFITGPFLTDLTISLLALTYIIYSLYNKNWQFVKNTFFIAFFIFCIFLIINGFLSGDYKKSLLSNEAVIFYFRYLFFIFASVELINSNLKKISWLKISLLTSIILVLVDSYIQFFLGVNLLGYEKYQGWRLTSFFKDETIVGQFLVKLLLVFILLSFITNHKRVYSEFFINLLIILTFIITLISGERLALFIISSFILGLLIYKSPFQRKFLYTVIIISFSSLIIYFMVPDVNARINQTLLQISSNQFSFLPYTPEHEKHYIIALRMFFDSPIFGIGPAMFESLCNDYNYGNLSGCASHPHNFYIQLLAENGLLGFSFMFIFYLYILKNFLKLLLNSYTNKNQTFEFQTYISYLIILCIFFPFVPHNDFFNNHLNFLSFFPLSISIFFIIKNKDR